MSYWTNTRQSPEGGWGTHMEALTWALPQTVGPIVEMGGGWFSTPILHGYAAATGRELWTVDDPVVYPGSPSHWIDEYEAVRRAYERPWHHFQIGKYEMPTDVKGGLVLVDQTAWYRIPAAMEAKKAGAGIIVVHDTEPSIWNMNNSDTLPDGSRPEYPRLDAKMEKKLRKYPSMYAALASFKYRVDFSVFLTVATAVSDTIPLDSGSERNLGGEAIDWDDPEGVAVKEVDGEMKDYRAADIKKLLEDRMVGWNL